MTRMTSNGELLIVRGRNNKFDNGKNYKKSSKSKSKPKKRSNKCWTCQRKLHFRCDCQILKKGLENFIHGDANVVFDRSSTPKILAISSKKLGQEWIIDLLFFSYMS